MDDESYAFNLNVKPDEHHLDFLSGRKVTELIVAYQDELSADTAFRKLFTTNPRTNLQVPEEVRLRLTQERERLGKARARQTELEKAYNPDLVPGWQTTNPETFDPNNFRFIVHAAADEHTRAQLAIARLQMQLTGEQMEVVQQGSVFEDPETFLNRR